MPVPGSHWQASAEVGGRVCAQCIVYTRAWCVCARADLPWAVCTGAAELGFKVSQCFRVHFRCSALGIGSQLCRKSEHTSCSCLLAPA